MRWNDVVTLLSQESSYQDASGAWHEGVRSRRTVFCNPMTIGVMAMANLRSSDVRMSNSTDPVDVGLRNQHMLQVKAIDYEGEDQCEYHGDLYEVLYSSGSGENRTLTIAQRIGDTVEIAKPTDDSGGGDGE